MATAHNVEVEAILTAPELATRVTALQRDRGDRNLVITDEDVTLPDEFNYNTLAGIIFASLNGRGDVQEQRVKVEFLSRDQLLVLPKGLGVSPVRVEHSEARHDNAIAVNFLKAGRLTYDQIYNIVDTPGAITAKLAAYRAIQVNAQDVGEPAWNQPNYYTRAGLGDQRIADEPEVYNYVFGLFSRILKLNCDIRDVGSLVGLRHEMRMGDNEWSLTRPNDRTRLTSKLMPYTMQMIAALNVTACSGFVIGAWIRSFGVCCGVLPARDTLLNKEWKYTSAEPLLANINAVDSIHDRLGGELNSLCLNLLAMFGLLHLNKNHTFITGDASMSRICTSYINTLRTMVPLSVIEELKGNMEVTCRTASHPFGLGQTYAVAMILHRISGLASPLDLRITVTPPLTQRLMIVSAAAAEWEQLPVGKTMTKLFEEMIVYIREEIKVIKGGPPHYSELHRYYGIQDMIRVSDQARDFANSMMPVVGGYANVMHVTGKDERDGIALAMSFLNVNRDSKAATTAFTTLWNKYLDTLEEKDLGEFMTQAFTLKKQADVHGFGGGVVQ